MSWLRRYYHWLHGQWPAGTVEKLPLVAEAGVTNVRGLRVVGDLAGVPLLKFAADSAAAAVQAIARELPVQRDPALTDVAIIGGGVAGVSAALEARRLGLSCTIYETARPFSTVANFPKGKPIFTYPVHMNPRGGLTFNERCDTREGLLSELEAQRVEAGIETIQAHVHEVRREGGGFLVRSETATLGLARQVIMAIGRTGSFRSLGVPGETLPKVSNRLHDAKDFAGKKVLVVGGGDSAVEAAIALTEAGADTTLAHRGSELSRPKPENVERLLAMSTRCEAEPCGSLTLALGARVTAIREDSVDLVARDERHASHLENDQVFVLIGREPRLDFLRRCGISLAGEWGWNEKLGLAAMLLFSLWIYHWKSWYLPALGMDPAAWWSGVQAERGSFLHALAASASQRGFYYSLAYCLAVTWFGWQRVKRRKTPYVRRQTVTLVCIQWLPLFLLPELLLPWMGRNEWFTTGALQSVADAFFPSTDGLGLEREYWRAYGFILAWPLFVHNWFSSQPLWGWLIVGGLQTFVLIPWMVRRWGKGAYCGWICSCGALAETMGDTHRHKMPHGPRANRWNMVGQVFLAFAALLMLLRIAAWCAVPGAATGFDFLFKGLPVMSYSYFVDLLWAGVIGIAFYFHYSGRVWCRFGCPLAALMHIYARLGKFRIFAEKVKCISCNVCTSVCHQGIDVMAFASRGLAMQDPQCVRCSACVQQCPTGVLNFGRLEAGKKIVLDKLPAKSA